MITAALIIGVAGGAGLAILFSALPALQRNVSTRIAPYVTDISPAAFEHARRPRNVDWVRVAVSSFSRQMFERFGPAAVDLVVLARRANIAGGAAGARQNTVVGASAGLVVASAFAVGMTGPVLLRLMLPLVGAVIGASAAMLILKSRAQRRARRIEHELPTVIEFLTLCVSAGEALPDAIRRIADRSAGELATELRTVVRVAALGAPLTTALTELADELRIPAFDRFVAQLKSAIDHGSPLVDVFRAQSGDLRVTSRRELMEAAGRKEIWMMLPLVFFILPVTILFAVWPGIIALNTGF